MVILVGPYGPLGEYLAFYLTISHVFLSRGFEMWYIYWFSDQSDDRWDPTLQTCSLLFPQQVLEFLYCFCAPGAVVRQNFVASVENKKLFSSSVSTSSFFLLV